MGLKFLGVLSLVGLALVGTEALSASRFGAKLDINTQPSNAGSGIFCNTTTRPDCTWVLMDAYQCEFGACLKGHLAPKTGTIVKLRLIACFPGSFALQIARTVPAKKQARVIRTGPLITYKGDVEHCEGDNYQIETFNVSVPVTKNDYLAVVTQKLGFVRCSGGGNNTLVFIPPLPDGGPIRNSTRGEGCFMLLEAIYSN